MNIYNFLLSEILKFISITKLNYYKFLTDILDNYKNVNLLLIKTEMTPEQFQIIKEQISEIREYREVLSRLFKSRVSLNQAIADWFEKGFHKGFEKSKNPTKNIP